MEQKQRLCLIEVDRPLTESEHFDRDIIDRFIKKHDMVIDFYDRVGTAACRIEVVLLKQELQFREMVTKLFSGFGSPEIQKEGYSEFEIKGIEKETFYEALARHFAPEIRMFSIEKPL